MRARQFQLARRPHGRFVADDLELVEVDLDEPGDGQVLVRNVALSVDPYMRPKMDDVPSYTPPYALHEAMEGRAVGVVVASGDPELAEGDAVVHRAGWRDHALLPASEVQRVEPSAQPLTAYLGVLGTTGFTAWVGLTRTVEVRPGDVAWVSAAAGGVGSIAGQIARLRGASRVVGSAGGPAKVAHVCHELGFDAAVDHRAGDLVAGLREAMPDGCDVYFDNVGGDHLAAAIDLMRDHGRISLCGAVSAYESVETPTVPANMFRAVTKRLTLRGFILSDHLSDRETFVKEMSGWLDAGEIRSQEWVHTGLESTPAAFAGLLEGRNTGKTVVRLAADDGEDL